MGERIPISREDLNLLFAKRDGNAALLYLWLESGREAALPMTKAEAAAALEVLKKLGLYTVPTKPLPGGEKPTYSEDAVARSLQQREFSAMVGEVQRLLGRLLSTEELKCLLCIQDYLRFPTEVVTLLVSYCIQRNRLRGVRAPGMRTIEKEAYAWSDLGIDTAENAIAHIQAQMARMSREGKICAVLQIGGRKLTAAEEKYVEQWLTWGFEEQAVRMAYEKTCVNTGGLKWPYLHSILKSWHEKGLHTVAEIREGDVAAKPTAKKGANKLNKSAVMDFLKEE